MSVRQAQLLFIVGADELAGTTDDGRPKYAGCTDLYQLFDRREPAHMLRLDKHALRQRKRVELEPYRCILNLITDPDQNARTLENVAKLLRGYRGKIINSPEAVLHSTRDRVARLLDGTPGLIAPKVLRLRNSKPDLAIQAIERAELRFPLIVRRAGTHTGKIAGLFSEAHELRAGLTEPGDHVAIEFVDFRSTDGVYRKYRSFFIGDRIIFRHMLASDQWNIHARERMRFMIERPELIEEEKALFEQPAGCFAPGIVEALKAVRDRMPLDYFGMDFGITPDGRVVLFEANATMNFFPFLADPRLDHVKRCREPAREAFHAMLGCSRRNSISFGERLEIAR